MKINALEVDGYGVWSGLKLDGLSDELNVFFGPNEAGKTTLMQFVRSVLYGFSGERQRYLPPLHGGRPGGSLLVASQAGRFHISRHAASRPGEADALEVIAPDGTRQDERGLKKLLGDIDERIFNNVFAVGLQELQELGALSDTQAAAMLYSLSIGLDRVPLVEVIRDLDTSRNHVLSREGGPCEVGRMLAEREKLHAEIEELGALTRTWGRLAAEREQVERETSRLEEEHREAAYQARAAEIAVHLRQRWEDRKTLDEKLAALGPVEPVPDGAVERLDAIRSRIDDRQARLAAWKLRWDELRAEAKGLAINEALSRLAPRIEALQEQEGWIGTLEKRVGELETEIAQLEAQIATERRQLGLGDDDKPMAALNARSLGSLRRPARSLSRCRRAVEEAHAQVAAAGRTAETISGQVEAALSERGQTNLGDAMDRLGGLVAQLRRRVQIDERIEQMESYQSELETQSRSLVDRQMLPLGAVLGLGAMFVVGAVMVVLSALGWLPVPGWAAGLLAALGMVGAVTSVGAKWIFERSSARRLAGCQKQVAMLHAQMRQAREEREALDRQLPPGDAPVAARLKTAEKELAALEEVVPLDARRQAAGQEIEAAKSRAAEAQRALAATQKRWKDAVTAMGLPAGFSPRQVRLLSERCDEIGEIRRRLDLRYEDFQQRNRELEGVTGRITRLASEAGLPLAEKHPAEQLRLMVEQLAEQETRLKRRAAIHAQARQLRRQRAKIEASLRKLKGRRRDLLQSAGAQDETDFRRRAELAGQVQSLRAERQAIQREIDAAIAGSCPEEIVRQHLEGPASEPLEARRDALGQRAKAAQERRQEQFERRGRLQEQIRVLAADRGPAAKQLELGMVEKRLEEAIHRWRVQAVACRILDEVRMTYERQRQPETLQEASCYLERLTQGRYRRVWTPLDEDVLRVDDAEGKSLAVELLSRGSREQLFVSLRLALASSFARRGIVLPLVLDDVLVNFDTERARAAAAVFRDFADEGRQLFVFTCHEHIARLFRTLKTEVRELPSNGRAEPDILEPVKPAAKRKRRKKAEAPPPAPVVEPEEEPAVEIPSEPEPEPEIVEEEDATLDEEVLEPDLEDSWPDDDSDGSEALLNELDDEAAEEEEEEEDFSEKDAEDVDDEDADEPEELLDEEEDVEDDDRDGAWRSRRFKDDWDDEYEDEYDEEEENDDYLDEQEEQDEGSEDDEEEPYEDLDEEDDAEAA